MQIVFHLGVHCTDEDALLRCLFRNKAKLALQGIALPGPARYLPIFQDATRARHNPLTPPPREALLDSILDEEAPRRVVFSSENILGGPPRAVSAEGLYAGGEERLARLVSLFPEDRIELFMAIRSPATFLHGMRSAPDRAVPAELPAGDALKQLQWSDLIERIRKAVPQAALTVWCDEDMPLIWPEVVGMVADYTADTRMHGLFDRLAPLLGTDGLKRLRSYLASHPPATAEQRRTVVSAFLSRFALPEAIDVQLDLPGWTAETVNAVNERYEEDIERIARIPDVRLVLP